MIFVLALRFDIIFVILFLTVKLSVLYGFGFFTDVTGVMPVLMNADNHAYVCCCGVADSVLFTALGDSPVNNLPRSLPLLDGILSLSGWRVRFSVRAVESK